MGRKKLPEQEFEECLTEAGKDPMVQKYINSYSIMVGQLVLKRRLELGWTQRELAQRAGTKQGRISEIEAGFVSIKNETLNKVFMALGLTELSGRFNEEAAVTAV